MEVLATEFQEQCQLVRWLELMNVTFTSIPNSTYTKSIQQKMKNRQSGLRPGLPDLLIALPGTGTLWIELKRTKRGVISPAQRDWIDTLNACPGNQAFVCKGFDAARIIIEQFIGSKPLPPSTSVF